MSVTLYPWKDYKGDARHVNDAAGRSFPDMNSFNGFWDNDLDAVRMDDGLRVCLYEHPNYGGHSICLDHSSGDVGYNGMGLNQASSLRVYKNCEHSRWTWDTDCADGNKAVNGGRQIDNQANECDGANLVNDTRCRDWCSRNPTKCTNSFRGYCKSQDGIRSTVCETVWCPANPGECDNAATEWCANNPQNNEWCGCFSENAMYMTTDAFKESPAIKGLQPQCWSSNCTTKGYFTKGMREYLKGNNCPKCIQTMSFNNITSGSGINFKGLAQSCNIDTDTGKAEAQQYNNAPVKNTESEKSDESSSFANWLYTVRVRKGDIKWTVTPLIIAAVLLLLAISIWLNPSSRPARLNYNYGPYGPYW